MNKMANFKRFNFTSAAVINLSFQKNRNIARLTASMTC